MNTSTEGKTKTNKNKQKQKCQAIDAAKFSRKGFTAYRESTATYYPESSSSIRKYFGIHTTLIGART